MAVNDFKEKKESEILQESKQIYEWVFKDKIFYFIIIHYYMIYKTLNSVELVLVFSIKNISLYIFYIR